jgi:hypothetical protein
MKILLNTSLVVLLALTFSTNANAQSRRSRNTGTYTDSTSYTSSTSSSGGNTGRMAASGALGFYANGGVAITANNAMTGVMPLSGLFGLGGDFDYFTAEDISIGGIFRYYSTADTAGPTEYTATAMTLGGIIRAYVFDTTHWSGNIGAGLGMLSTQAKVGGTSIDSGTGFGFYYSMTLLYKMSGDMAFGIENLRAIGLGSALNGWALSDYMGKIRFMF